MLRIKLLAMALMAAGGSLIHTASSQPAQADTECHPQEVSPAECVHPEEVIIDPPNSMGCFPQGDNECHEVFLRSCSGQPGNWGFILNPYCDTTYTGGSEPVLCNQEWLLIEFDNHYMEARCQIRDGVCMCAGFPSEVLSRKVEICDCFDSSEEP